MLYFVKDSPEHRLTQSHWSTNTQSQEEAEEAGISKCSKYVYLQTYNLLTPFKKKMETEVDKTYSGFGCFIPKVGKTI